MPLLVASASLASAVTPTTVPLAAFSATLLAAALLSLTAPTSNSSTSVTLMVKFCGGGEPAAAVANTPSGMARGVPPPVAPTPGAHPGRRIEADAPASIVREAVGDAAVGRVG